MIQDKIFFDEKDPTGLSYNTPFTVYGSYQGRLWSKTPTGSIKFYTQNSDLSVYATTGSNQFSGSQTVTGSLTVTGGITGTVTTASYVEYAGVANKPALVSSSAQIVGYNIFATTGSNQFNGSQAITGSLTVTGQVVAQTLNVQQVTSSIVFSSGSNIFGNSLSNTQQFTGSVSVTGSLAISGTGAFSGALSLNSSANRINSGNELRFYRTDNGIYTQLYDGGNANGFVLDNRNGDGFNFQSAGTSQFRIASTGAATFASSVTSNGKLTVSQASTDFVGEFINTSAANPYGIRVRDASGAANNYPLLQVVNNAGSVEYFRVNSGTGTATFSSSVTAAEGIINGTSTYLLSLNNTSQDVRLQLQVNGTQTFQLSSSSSQVNIYGATNIPMIFYTNATERMRITSGGNVGIGTTNPSFKLEVAGTVRIQDTLSFTNGDSGQAIFTNNSTAVSVSTTTALGGSFSMGGSGAFVIVYGSQSTNVFIDTIIAANTGTPTVLNSTTVSGSPSARTYSTASNRLQLAMASGTYDVRINILRIT